MTIVATPPAPLAVSAAATPAGTHRIQLLPWLRELSILTKDLRVVKLGDVLHPGQLAFIDRCQGQLDRTGRIRQVVLKARQMGFSTIIEGILFLFAVLNEDMNCLIVSHEQKSAEGILKMTKRYWAHYPFRRFHIPQYAGRRQLSWADIRSNIEVATAKNVAGGRSSTIQCLHASEVAFWDDPETLMTGLRQAIPSYGLTAIFIESTANGVGNYFHRVCTSARKGQSEFDFNFYAWWEHPEYTAAYVPTDELERYALLTANVSTASAASPAGTFDKEEQSLIRRFKLPVERLLWRRWAIENLCQGDLEKFHQEYPSDPDEAFVSTGRNVFPLPSIIEHARLELGRRGRLSIDSRQRVTFQPDASGPFTIFRPPSPDRGWGIYLIGADPTHTTAGDNACGQVINRRTLEQVAVYRRKTDPITFAKDMELLGRFYNDALLAPEKTGPGYATVGALVASGYTNIHSPVNVTQMQGVGNMDVAGWATNVATKHLAISHLLRAIKEPLAAVGGSVYGLVIHDEQTAAEMRDYVTTEDGKGYANGDGSPFDDGVMALAIAVAVHNIEPPVAAYESRAPHEQPTRLPREVAPPPVGKPLSAPPDPAPARAADPSSDADLPPLDDFDRTAPWESWGRKD